MLTRDHIKNWLGYEEVNGNAYIYSQLSVAFLHVAENRNNQVTTTPYCAVLLDCSFMERARVVWQPLTQNHQQKFLKQNRVKEHLRAVGKLILLKIALY